MLMACFIPYLYNWPENSFDRLSEVHLTEIAFIFIGRFEQVTVLSEDVVEIHSIGVLEQKCEDKLH